MFVITKLFKKSRSLFEHGAVVKKRMCHLLIIRVIISEVAQVMRPLYINVIPDRRQQGETDNMKCQYPHITSIYAWREQINL